MTKNEIRKQYKEKRNSLTTEEIRTKSSFAANAFLDSRIYKVAECIMIYMPLGNEIDTREIMKRALEDGKKLVFPVTEKESGRISLYFADRETVFKKGNFSVLEPQNAMAAEIEVVDAFIVPGLAFDKSGGRIGFGKGCYDMLLECMDAVKVGFCYDFQVKDAVSVEEHDVRMDFLLTESGLYKCDEEEK